MSIRMSAHCDSPRCTTIQTFFLEDPSETGQSILDGLVGGGWGVQGTFTKTPKTVKLTCPFCMRTQSSSGNKT